MKWKTFFQIILLIAFAVVVFYMVYPKYATRKGVVYNRITGRDVKREIRGINVAPLIEESK